MLFWLVCYLFVVCLMAMYIMFLPFTAYLGLS